MPARTWVPSSLNTTLAGPGTLLQLQSHDQPEGLPAGKAGVGTGGSKHDAVPFLLEAQPGHPGLAHIACPCQQQQDSSLAVFDVQEIQQQD